MKVRARQPGVKILYMSGHPASAVGVDTSLDPDAAFLQKPFTASQLARKVREVLDKK